MTTVRRVPMTTLTSGMELALYIHEMRGTLGDGPTLGLSAAIHGDEPGGIHMIMEIARRYGGGNFRGRLLLLPVANPLAFEAYSRNTPLDAQNMNRLFPGNPGGRFTEQLVALITSEFLNVIDVYIDIHTAAQPTVDYIYILNAEDLSRSFGSRVLYRFEASRAGPTYEGVTTSVTLARGVPSVTVELGGGMIDQTPYIARGVPGIENIMRTLGMLDGEPDATAGTDRRPRDHHGASQDRRVPLHGGAATRRRDRRRRGPRPGGQPVHVRGAGSDPEPRRPGNHDPVAPDHRSGAAGRGRVHGRRFGRLRAYARSVALGLALACRPRPRNRVKNEPAARDDLSREQPRTGPRDAASIAQDIVADAFGMTIRLGKEIRP